ncbi:MAG TPA: hypothetical protein VIF62_18695 [Labilithrix sp.]|jgi:hypothetical protein
MSPWRDEANAALERAARLEDEVARLRAELARRNSPPARRKRPDARLLLTLLAFGALGGTGAAFAAMAVIGVGAPPREPVAVFSRVEPAGPSYESTLATFAAARERDAALDEATLRAPIGSLAECPRPAGMRTNVRVAVIGGRAAGVSVFTTPRDPEVANCIDRQIRRLSWPAANGLSTLVTTL